MPENPNLIGKLTSSLPRDGLSLLHSTLRCAEDLGLRLFLVGGPVRDLVLGRPVVDLDVSVEGDAAHLARACARSAGARVAKTTAFGTASLKTEAFVLDLVTARGDFSALSTPSQRSQAPIQTPATSATVTPNRGVP